MRTRFLILDVFTDRRFGGNPLAVLPDARGLDAAAMQRVAREFNFSESTFVLPPESGGDRRVRIFTPGSEVPLQATRTWARPPRWRCLARRVRSRRRRRCASRKEPAWSR